MSRYRPRRGFEPDPRVGRRGELVNRPTVDLVEEAKRQGTYRDDPFLRDGRRRGRREGGKRGWWNEPRRGDTDRWETLTGGNRLSSDSERMDLLTGKRSLPGDSERMRLLTGESDFGGRGSRYGGRREYDPQDRDFNRQFNTEPTNNRDVRSWFPDSEPSRPVSKPSSFPDDVGPGTKYPYGKPDPSHPPGVIYSKDPRPAPNTNQGYDDSSVRERLRSLEGRPQTGGWQEDRIAALESRSPIVNQPTVDLSGVEGRISQLEGKGSDWQEDRIAALEGRKPQDLSGIQGRLSELEDKGPSWQEDRISQLEGSRTQSKSARDLLDQRLASLENYYKNDPPPPPDESTGNRYEDKQAQLNKMWEQTGNVYDPEAFAIGNTWQKTKDDPTPSWFTQERRDANDYVRNKDWYGGTGSHAEASWARDLPDTYRKQMRDLDKEYNKPSHSAIIKGREYTAYGPAASARLKMLDEQNIHEDEYLGQGTWENKFGEEISGRGGASSGEKRYFASHSGLDPEGEEYAQRFRRSSALTGEGGKETNYYQKQQAGTLDENEKWWWDRQGGYKPEEHGKYGWGVVGTNKSKTGQTKWDEAYYPELG